MERPSLCQRLAAELIGAFFLLAAIIGSGVMAERLAGGNEGLALLCNTLATGAMLVVLIAMLAPLSGAHLNPAVSLVARLRGELTSVEALAYMSAQVAGAVLGVLAAHIMFDEALFQLGEKVRAGPAIVFAEGVATFGLVLTVLLTIRARPEMVSVCVGLYIVSAYWFTSSTSFANPAVTLARALTDTFAGIRPVDVPPFVAAELAAAILAMGVATFLDPRPTTPRG
jgi:glycerol uptake facilitator-like aquaporin